MGVSSGEVCKAVTVSDAVSWYIKSMETDAKPAAENSNSLISSQACIKLFCSQNSLVKSHLQIDYSLNGFDVFYFVSVEFE